MLKREQVILMTKLAIKEKNRTKDEKMTDNYYESDYIYIHNWRTRISITLAYLMIAGLYYVTQIFTGKLNLLDLHIPELIRTHLLIFGSIIVLFSLLSTIVCKARYQRASEKNNEFYTMLRQLREMRKEG